MPFDLSLLQLFSVYYAEGLILSIRPSPKFSPEIYYILRKLLPQLLFSLPQSLPIPCRCLPVGPLEGIVKCSGIAKAYIHGNLVDFFVSVQKQCDCMFQADLIDIVLEIFAGAFMCIYPQSITLAEKTPF